MAGGPVRGRGRARPSRLLSSSTTSSWTASPGASCWRTCRRRASSSARGRRVEPPAEDDVLPAWARAAARARDAERGCGRRARVLARVVGPGLEPLPVDHAGGASRTRSGRRGRCRCVLGEEETRALLQEVPAAYRTQIADVLLTAVLRGVRRLDGPRRAAGRPGGPRPGGAVRGRGPVADRGLVHDDLPRAARAGGGRTRRGAQGRQGAAARRARATASATGCCATCGAGGRCAARRQVSLQLPRAVRPGPRRRRLSSGRRSRARGRRGAERGRARAPHRGQRPGGGRAAARWTGRTARPCTSGRRSRALARRLRDGALGRSIEHCRSGAWGCTPSDFPLARLDQARLDRVVGGRRDVEDVYPLSPMQEGMLFHTPVSPGTGPLLRAGTVRARRTAGRPRRCGEAWRARRGAPRDPADPLLLGRAARGRCRCVERERRLPWEEEDWSGISRARSRTRGSRSCWRRTASAASTRGRAPLMRLTLVRLGEESHRLVWSFHHALLDGWCLPLRLEGGPGASTSRTRAAASASSATSVRTGSYIAWLAGQDLGSGGGVLARRRSPGFRRRRPWGWTGRRGSRSAGGRGAGSSRSSETATAALRALGTAARADPEHARAGRLGASC